MRFPIAAVLLDADRTVLDTIRMRPRRVLMPHRGVRHVLECPPEAVFERGEIVNWD